MAEKPTYTELEQRVRDLEKQLADKKNPPTGNPSRTSSDIRNADAAVGAKKRILVIDDSKVDRMIMEEILSQAGYEVALAFNGREGLERFYENPADLVITDMVMPGKMGIDLILEIREKYPHQKIMAISAGSDFGPEIELSMAEELKAYTVTKPFDPERILKIIDDLLFPEVAQEAPDQDEEEDQIEP